MKPLRSLLLFAVLLLSQALPVSLLAADAPAAATVPLTQAPASDLLKHLVAMVLTFFNLPAEGNTGVHYLIAALALVVSFLLRHVVTRIIFRILKKFAERTETTLDDKLFPQMEAPTAALITVIGVFVSISVLTLSPGLVRTVNFGFAAAFSLVIFWGVFRAFNAVLDHAHEVAIQKQMGVAAFMPWIKKTLIAIFVVIGLLMVVQSLGYNVKTILGAAGIGGLAFALAAQDTIANLFGSLVVATDQPFKIGETIRVDGNVGTVEDIGLRSTKLRLVDKSLLVIPNKTMASESIANLSRFKQRRVDQVLGLTYDTTAEKMEQLLVDLRALLNSDEGVEKQTSNVAFTEFGDSSMNIQIIYYTITADFAQHLQVRERVNLKMMRLILARGLSMAFPTRTLILDGPIAKQLAAARAATTSPEQK